MKNLSPCLKCETPTWTKVCYDCICKQRKQTVKDRLDRIRNVNPKCYFCRAKKTIFQIHHIDMDNDNNKKHNLMLLCASCHGKLHKGIYPKLENIKKPEITEVKINGINYYKK